MSGVFSKVTDELLLKEQLQSLGLSFDLDILDGIDYENNTRQENDNSSSYLQKKVSLEEVREIPANSNMSVEELEQMFMKSYISESLSEDLLFDRWKGGDSSEGESDDEGDEGDFDEPSLCDFRFQNSNNEGSLFCQPANSCYAEKYDDVEDPYETHLSPMLLNKENIIKEKKTTDFLKQRAFNTPFAAIERCNPATCPYKGSCIDESTFGEVYQMKVDFWGALDEEGPSRELKRKLILKILTKSFRRSNRTFEFIIGNKDKDNRLVCEAAYLIVLGLSNNKNASQAPSQWRNTKKFVLDGHGFDDLAQYSYSEVTNSGKMKREEKSTKYNHAITFIHNYAINYGDTNPGENGGEKTRIVPFYHLKSFHEEYLIDSAFRNVLAENVASKTVFSDAYYHLYKTEGLRKLKSKGSFNTCEICNNAEFIRNNKHRRLTMPQREIIKRFETLHLSQQANERRFLDDRKLRAEEMDGIRPKRALLFPDAMTHYTCLTPRFQLNSKGDQKIESRLIGVEVYCGPIKTVFIYRTDSLVFSGADIMIEVVRQAMIDLCAILRKRNLLTPRELWLQFDNSGENKNKEMFTYLSMLVEDSIFDSVEIAFLIVGHTHASIDQYFSLISKAIHSKETVFIGSPLSLLELVRQCHYQKYTQDPVIRDISVYFDIVTAFQPYLNDKITYYKIPYYFLIKPIFLRVAAMQHKMFSGNSLCLPLPADMTITSEDHLKQLLVDDVTLPSSFSLFNGELSVKNHFGIDISKKNGTSQNDAFGNVTKSRELHHINQSLPDLLKLSSDSLYQQLDRMDDEAYGRSVKQFYNIRKEVQKKLKASSDAEKGYILWLKLGSRNEEEKFSKWGELIKPKPFNPKVILDNFSVISAEVERAAAIASNLEAGLDDIHLISASSSNINTTSNGLIEMIDSSITNTFSVDSEKQSHHLYSDNAYAEMLLEQQEDEILVDQTVFVSDESNKNRESNNNNNNNNSNVSLTVPTNLPSPLNARDRRIFKGAEKIATAARWVLSQVNTKITLSQQMEFDKNFLFKAPVLSMREYQWYLNRNTTRKVIEIVVKEFENSPPWELLPVTALTSEDLERIAEEEEKVQVSIMEAKKIANNLLTRIGDNVKETDQIVLFGPNAGAESIKMMAKHYSRGGSTNRISEPKLFFYKCDVIDCTKIAKDKEGRCSEINGCKKGLRYCVDHLKHENHSNLSKRKKREKVDIENMVAPNTTNPSDVINNNNNNNNIDNSNNNNSTTDLSIDQNVADDTDDNNNNNNSRNDSEVVNHMTNENHSSNLGDDYNSSEVPNNEVSNNNSRLVVNINNTHINNNNNININIGGVEIDTEERINSKRKKDLEITNSTNLNKNKKSKKDKNSVMWDNMWDDDNKNLTDNSNNNNKNENMTDNNSDCHVRSNNPNNDDSNSNSNTTIISIMESNKSNLDKIPSLIEILKILHMSDDKDGINMSILTDHYFNGVKENDSRYKLFNRIRHSVVSEKTKPSKKQNINERLESELNFVVYMDDLQYLISNIYKLEEGLIGWNFESKLVTTLKKESVRRKFLASFVSLFVNKYCE